MSPESIEGMEAFNDTKESEVQAKSQLEKVLSFGEQDVLLADLYLVVTQ